MTVPEVLTPGVSAESERRVLVRIRGVVQGVGFRPFVYRMASSESLRGWVRNESGAVTIEAQGERPAVARFLIALREQSPAQARVEEFVVTELSPGPCEAEAGFVIDVSRQQAVPQPAIPADLATCDECLEEIFDPQQRRRRYPFTNCTRCGPRWSIIRRMPYDRRRTSMSAFAMCGACAAEYDAPADRRFHAQPIACPACGPQLRLLTAAGQPLAVGERALRATTDALAEGRIVAIKGLGGFQLIADATRAETIRALRARKRRPDKPLAVMLADLTEVQRYCRVSPQEAAQLTSPAAPILLLPRLETPDGPPLAEPLAPGNPYLGVMLPYTPLHHLLVRDFGRAILCTSGNVSDEPMAIRTDQAIRDLGRIADRILTHNRPIVRPVDDSVGHVVGGTFQVLRRARGYAPLPLRMAQTLPRVLAVGGHLKNTVAIGLGREVVLGSHGGDLDNARAVEVHRRAVEDLLAFFDFTPECLASDLHPDYASTRQAEHWSRQWGVPLVGVQHHHAHVGACMAEHGLSGPVLGIAWDGTGYGPDGTVWGGEFLRCEGARFDRLAHLRPFPLPGGDAAARQPRRSALGLLYVLGYCRPGPPLDTWFATSELRPLLQALGRPGLFPLTSSMGRLFDAVAALAGLPWRVSFEGQAAMALEFAVEPDWEESYPIPLGEGMPAQADWEPLVRAVCEDRAAGLPLSRIAAQFHNGLAELALAVARRGDCPQVVLTGGCFQNRRLSERVHRCLSAAGFEVFTHRHVPPGDGGIALGQLWLAAQSHKESLHVSGNPR